MPFKPRMTSLVKKVVPLESGKSLLREKMAIDYWRVEIGQGAEGRYLSPDPRFVIFLKGGSISLGPIGGAASAACRVCYVPADLPLCGVLGAPRCLEHLDIHIQSDNLRAAVGPSVNLDAPLFLPESDDLRQITSLLADECREPRRQEGYSEALAIAAIHEVFAIDAGERASRGQPIPVRCAMAYAVENLDQPLSVDRMADAARVSRFRLTRLFAEHTGLTPWRWVMQRRLEDARRLLAEGESVGRVAHATGFADQAHFSRCFRSATGLPPARWMREHGCSNAAPILQDG